MTTVRYFRRPGGGAWPVEGMMRWAALVCLVGLAPARGEGPAHWRHAGALPPGAIGRQRLLRGGPLSGYCQLVEIRAPQGARISPLAGAEPALGQSRLLVGLQIGPVYRFKVSDVPEHPGLELFPTVEMIDRTYPPPQLARKFPVPIDLPEEELLAAADGQFITRVVYVEDPQLALPIAEKAGEPARWHEVRPGEDPLVVAEGLGRPIAIVRIGGRVPQGTECEDPLSAAGPEPVVYDAPTPADAAAPPAAIETLPANPLPPAAVEPQGDLMIVE